MFRRAVQAPAPVERLSITALENILGAFTLLFCYMLRCTRRTSVKGDTIYARCNRRNYRRYNDEGVFKIALREERVITWLFEFLSKCTSVLVRLTGT